MMREFLNVLLIVILFDFSYCQYYGQPLFFYQAPVSYYQEPVYQPQYQQQPYVIPVQYQYHQQPQLQPQYYYQQLPQYHTANSIANNMLLLREIEAVGSRGGNEFRDKEGTFEEPNRFNSAAVGLSEHSKYLSLISDKDNFQTSGCSWDLIQMKCVDGLGLCKGGCRDFAVSHTATLHDCRCIPYGYAALLKLAGK